MCAEAGRTARRVAWRNADEALCCDGMDEALCCDGTVAAGGAEGVQLGADGAAAARSRGSEIGPLGGGSFDGSRAALALAAVLAATLAAACEDGCSGIGAVPTRRSLHSARGRCSRGTIAVAAAAVTPAAVAAAIAAASTARPTAFCIEGGEPGRWVATSQTSSAPISASTLAPSSGSVSASACTSASSSLLSRSFIFAKA